MNEQKWSDTIAARCRWSEYAAIFFGDGWHVIFDASQDDYQGTVEIIAIKRNWENEISEGKYLEYSYGSCSGCDAWEGEPEEKIMTEMLRCIQPLKDTSAVIAKLQTMLVSDEDYDWRERSKKARALINALQPEPKEGAK